MGRASGVGCVGQTRVPDLTKFCFVLASLISRSKMKLFMICGRGVPDLTEIRFVLVSLSNKNKHKFDGYFCEAMWRTLVPDMRKIRFV